jgi:hypothetical protein
MMTETNLYYTYTGIFNKFEWLNNSWTFRKPPTHFSLRWLTIHDPDPASAYDELITSHHFTIIGSALFFQVVTLAIVLQYYRQELTQLYLNPGNEPNGEAWRRGRRPHKSYDKALESKASSERDSRENVPSGEAESTGMP